MWRALFLALGITLCIIGAECLGLEKVVLKVREPATQVEANSLSSVEPSPGPRKVFIIKEFAPWSLLATGAVVILWAYDLPRRLNA